MEPSPSSLRPGESEPRIRRADLEDRPAVLELLRGAGLPTDGVEDHWGAFVVAEMEEGRSIVGAAGLEHYGGQGILRSVVVASQARSRGVGGRLVDAVVETARREGVRELFLLTVDADGYFGRWGFETVPRQQVDGDVLRSAEFQGACPDTAVVMRLRLAH